MNVKKILAMILAIVLLMTATIAGTIAWLTDDTQEVKNTFTVGDINIDLWEHELKADNTLDEGKKVQTNTNYKIVPGDHQLKNPTVTVEAKSEDCWVFIQVQEVNNTRLDNDNDGVDETKVVEWTHDAGKWTKLEGPDNKGLSVYYLTDSYTTQTTDKDYQFMTGITYNDELTKSELDALDGIEADGKTDTDAAKAEIAARPQLNFKAFAVQKEAAGTNTGTQGATTAWAEVPATAYLGYVESST